MSASWWVGVIVPARDEAESIADCVASVRASLAAAPTCGAHVVVVADRCTDATAERAARALGADGQVVSTGAGNVGHARQAGTDRALAQLLRAGARPERTWLCATDADSTVPLAWVSHHLRLAEAGAAAVAGLVRVDGFGDHPAGVRERYLARYAAGITLEQGRTHRHVHGANLGVRADAYLAVGGWSGLSSAEDHDLWGRLQAGGWPVVSSVDSWVSTSGRRVGRAPDGFAGLLTSLGSAP